MGWIRRRETRHKMRHGVRATMMQVREVRKYGRETQTVTHSLSIVSAYCLRKESTRWAQSLSLLIPTFGRRALAAISRAIVDAHVAMSGPLQNVRKNMHLE